MTIQDFIILAVIQTVFGFAILAGWSNTSWNRPPRKVRITCFLFIVFQVWLVALIGYIIYQVFEED